MAIIEFRKQAAALAATTEPIRLLRPDYTTTRKITAGQAARLMESGNYEAGGNSNRVKFIRELPSPERKKSWRADDAAVLAFEQKAA